MHLREALAKESGASTRQVSIWFRNRRQRVRLADLQLHVDEFNKVRARLSTRW